MFLSTWLLLISAIPLAWASSFWVFCTLRFIIGMCTSGLYIAPFVLGKNILVVGIIGKGCSIIFRIIEKMALCSPLLNLPSTR